MKLISKKPEILTGQIQQMLKGINKFADTFQPAGPTAENLESTVANLTAALQHQRETAGVAERATQELYEIRDNAVSLARRTRDAIYAYFGKNDKRIVQFGLDTPKNSRSVNNQNDHEEEDNQSTSP